MRTRPVLLLILLLATSNSCDEKVNVLENCGDGVLDPGEECDTGELNGETCASLGHYDFLGQLGCKSSCTFDTTECGGKCGDGNIDVDHQEQCDGSNLSGNTCITLGYPGGVLACSAACVYDTSGCTGGCGDGNILAAAGEECDGDNLRGRTCEDLGFWSGDIGCSATCRFDTGPCVRPVALAAGFRHTCALSSGGTVRCWGGNNAGQLGDGTTTAHLMPEPVPGLTDIVAISGVYETNCALAEDGRVWCWGAGYDNSPVLIMGGGFVSVSGGIQGCGIQGDGTVDCWNGFAYPDPVVPATVAGLDGVVDLASSHNVCAVLEDGSARCMGDNSSGQLGDGTSTSSTVPVVVQNLAGAAGIQTGTDFNCAWRTDGSVLCWGSNSYGQLGNDHVTGDPVVGLSDAISVHAEYVHACALTGSGAVRCWGYGGQGRLGDGAMQNRYTSVAVVGMTDAVSVVTGHQHSCAIREDHSIWCWGFNGQGQLGNGATVDSAVPVEVMIP